MVEILEQHYYDDPLEAKCIRQVLSKLLDGFFYELERLKIDQYILTADELGISQLEKQFDIIPDLSTEDLAFRRQRLLNRNTTKPPFTLEYLENKLAELITDGSHKVVMDYPHYALDVEIGLDNAQLYNEIALTIDTIKPANIAEHLTWIRQLEKAKLHLGAALQTGTEMSIYPIFSDDLSSTYTLPIVAYYKQGTYLSVYPLNIQEVK